MSTMRALAAGGQMSLSPAVWRGSPAGAAIPCPLCLGLDREPVHAGAFPIVRCRDCSMVFAEVPEGAVDLDDLYRERCSLSALLPLQRQKVVQATRELQLLERVGDGRRILDIGCALGFFLQAAERRGWKTAGVEPSPDAADFARWEYGLEVFPGPLEASPYRDGSFDVVTVHRLADVPDPVGLLGQVRRCLRPGGLALVATPNIAGLSARLFGRGWRWFDPPAHLTYFDATTLATALRAAGFEPLHAETGRGEDERAAFEVVVRAHRWLRDHLPGRGGDGSGGRRRHPRRGASWQADRRRAPRSARWAAIRETVAAAALPLRPLGAALDRLGLGSEVVMVARALPGGDFEPWRRWLA